jgi:PAS domain S-box-containing protein
MNPPSPAPTPAESLATRDERLRRAFTTLPDFTNNLIAVVEHPGYRLLYLNPPGRRLLAIPPEEDLTSTTLTDLLPSRAVPALLYETTPTALKEGVWRGESVLWRRPATECPVALIVVGLPASEGHGQCLVISARDVSEHYQLEASLEHEQQLLRALLEHVPDHIYFKDLASRFIRVSMSKARQCGCADPSELTGKTDFDTFSNEHAQAAYDDEQRIIRTGQPIVDFEEKETWPDGRVTWVSTSKMPLYDADGRIIGTFGLSRDITARKETELKLAVTQKELLEASRLAGMAEIASGVLHNIGNALNSVNTSAALLVEQIGRSRVGNLAKAAQMIEEHNADLAKFLTEDSRGRQLPGYLIQLAGLLGTEREGFQRELELLRRNIEHIKEIVAMQQSYARVSSLLEDIAPADLVEEALRISEASLSRHGIGVQRDFLPVPLVRVTRHKVLQILVNLIRNAKHAMDDTGRTDKEMVIALRVGPTGGVQMIVRDNGVGIPAENLPKMFTFGFTTRKTGHGFGLHSSANTARELGGSLRGESEGPGTGAVFTLDLPAAPATPPPAGSAAIDAANEK